VDRTIPERYAGLVGLGLMYLWMCALFFWLDLAESVDIFKKVIGYGGMALTSVCGIAAFFYTSDLESELKNLKGRNSFYD
jgi:hypothetical protein